MLQNQFAGARLVSATPTTIILIKVAVAMILVAKVDLPLRSNDL
jgi:hypothetical protein